MFGRQDVYLVSGLASGVASFSLVRDRRVTYRDLFDANRLFEGRAGGVDSRWVLACTCVDWGGLSVLPRDVVMRDVVGFLNRSGCRLKRSLELVDGIQGAHREVIDRLRALDGLTLWDYDPGELILVRGQKLEARKVVLEVFQRFRDVGLHFRETAASKLLHMLNPFLFIMWDKAIAKAYGVSRTPWGYVHEFMPFTREKANQVIDSYMEEYGTTREEAVCKLNAYRPHKTLAKLLDEYDWIKCSLRH